MGREMTNEPTYYPNDKYSALVSALKRVAAVAPSLKIEVSPWTGRVEDDEVMIALGERFSIWPASILPHVEEVGSAAEMQHCAAS